MAKMHLLRAPSLGPRADDPDTFPRRGVRGGGRGILLYAPVSDHMPRTSRCHQEPTALGGHSDLQGQGAGAHFLSQHSRGAGRRGQGTTFTGQQVWAKGPVKGPQSVRGSCPLLGEDLSAHPPCRSSVLSAGSSFPFPPGQALSRWAGPLTACLH